MSDPLNVMDASDDASANIDWATVDKPASGGKYPMEYTVHYRGTYVINVTGPDGQVKRREGNAYIPYITFLLCVHLFLGVPSLLT